MWSKATIQECRSPNLRAEKDTHQIRIRQMIEHRLQVQEYQIKVKDQEKRVYDPKYQEDHIGRDVERKQTQAGFRSVVRAGDHCNIFQICVNWGLRTVPESIYEFSVRSEFFLGPLT